MNQTNETKDCTHVEDSTNPGHCVWCRQPYERERAPIAPAELVRVQFLPADHGLPSSHKATPPAAEPEPDPFAVVLLAVAEGAVFTLGPGSKRHEYAGTLECPTDPRYALAQGPTVHGVLLELAARWSRQS